MPTQTYIDQTFNQWDKTTKDSYALILGSEEPNSVVTNCKINANGAEWGLKMPNNFGSVIENCSLVGGKERALDMVRGGRITFNSCVFSNGSDRKAISSKWSLRKTCDIGIKGGFDTGEFNDCTFADMLLGDHCIYDNVSGNFGAKTKNIVLSNCIHPKGPNTPIILRIWNAEMPTLYNTNAIAIVYSGPIKKIYFYIAGKWIDSRKPIV